MCVAIRVRSLSLFACVLGVAWMSAPVLGEEHGNDDSGPPQPDIERSADPDDPFPRLPEAPMLTVVAMPTQVAHDDASQSEMSPAVWMAHALDRLLIHATHHTRGLGLLGGEALRDALAPYGSDESSEVIAAKLSRDFATPLQLGLAVDELGSARLRVTGWVRFDPRWLPEWQAAYLPFEVPAEPTRVELPAHTLKPNDEPEALYEALVEIANAAVRNVCRFAPEQTFDGAGKPLPDWQSFMAWVNAYLALAVGDWESADAWMEPVREKYPEHAAVATYRANSFATRQASQQGQSLPDDPEEAQRISDEMMRELNETADHLYAAIYHPERTYPLGLMAMTFTELTLDRGLPEQAELVLLKLLEKRPGYLRAWGTLLTRVKLALVHRRYTDSTHGFARVIEEVEVLYERFSESWPVRYLHAQVLNAVGLREPALELMDALDFDEHSLDPSREEALPIDMNTMVGLGNYHGIVLVRRDMRAALSRLLSVRRFRPESVEAQQNVFEQSVRALFARLDDRGNSRLHLDDVPTQQGVDRADVTDSGYLDSFEALGYYGVLGRGAIERTERELELFHYERLAEKIWSSALAWKALTGRWQIEIEAFLTGHMAQERYEALQRQADLRLSYLLDRQLEAAEETEEPQAAECQRDERVSLALQSWQLSELMLEQAADEERGVLRERLADSRERARHVFRHDRVMNEHLHQQAFPQRPSRFAPNPYAQQD